MSQTGVVLMEKGTDIQGSYASSVTQGQSRVVGVSAFATTPNGVVVPLGGPLADQLGASGVEGDVNNHWMQRLGGALLLSLVDSAFALAQTELQKAGSTNLNISTGSGVGGLASQLLAKTINIPPTIRLQPATRVALWVPSFIDFSPSYKLEIAR
jgi:type IV secretion system protein VirB10